MKVTARLTCTPFEEMKIAPYFVAVLVLTTTACTSSIISRPFTKADPSPAGGAPAAANLQGVPYFLPTSVLEVSLESLKDDKAQHKEFAVISGAKLVPDPSRGFLLDSPDQWYAGKTHEIKIKDGMLSTVSTEDENKIGDMIASLLGAAINVASFGATGGIPHASKDVTENPTAEELMELYTAVAPGNHSFVFTRHQRSRRELPGTNGLLQLAVEPVDEFGAVTVAERNANDPTPAARRDGWFGGIHARVLRPLRFDLNLEVPRIAFYTKRGAAFVARKKGNDEAIAQAAKDTAANARKRADLQQRKADLAGDIVSATSQGKPTTELHDKVREVDDALAALQEADDAIAEAKTKREADNDHLVRPTDGLIAVNNQRLNTAVPNAVFVVATRSILTMVPDEEATVLLPITKTSLGLSKNTVTLESGIITGFKTEKSSVGAAALKIVYDATGKIIELPTKIIQLKIDHSTKAGELAAAEKTALEATAALAKAKEPAAQPTPHDSAVAQLKQEKEITTLQKELAELRQAIAKASETN